MWNELAEYVLSLWVLDFIMGGGRDAAICKSLPQFDPLPQVAYNYAEYPLMNNRGGGICMLPKKKSSSLRVAPNQ